jgi:hypothetical protein
MDEAKKCDVCALTLTTNFFEINVTGYRSTCKKCRYERTKELRELRKVKNMNKLVFKKTKKCITCDETKNISEFNRLSVNKDGVCSYCRKCFKEKREQPKEEVVPIVINQSKRCAHCLNEKPINDFKKTARSNDGHYSKCSSCWKPVEWNKEKQKASEKRYIEKNPEKIRQKWKRDGQKINRRIRDSLNHRLKDAFNAVSLEKTNHLFLYIGCDTALLKKWFEYQFEQGMTFENYGEWHIDHVTPCASFDLSKDEDVQKCFHWHNLRPCWKTENLEKSSQIIPELIENQKKKVIIFLNTPLPNQPGDRVGGAE